MMNMMGMMGWFGPLFALIYLGLVIYFFYLLTNIAQSLRRIADRVEKMPAQNEPGKSQ